MRETYLNQNFFLVNSSKPITEGICYIGVKDIGCKITIIDIHASNEDKDRRENWILREIDWRAAKNTGLQHWSYTGDQNAKVGQEEEYQLTIRKYS